MTIFDDDPADGRDSGVLRTTVRELPALAVGLLFVVIGYTKFDDDPAGEWVRIFERIGVGQWLRIVTGLMQVAGGLLLPWRRSRAAGAVLLAATMVGAILVDLFVLGSPLAIIPMALLFVIAAVWVASA